MDPEINNKAPENEYTRNSGMNIGVESTNDGWYDPGWYKHMFDFNRDYGSFGEQDTLNYLNDNGFNTEAKAYANATGLQQPKGMFGDMSGYEIGQLGLAGMNTGMDLYSLPGRLDYMKNKNAAMKQKYNFDKEKIKDWQRALASKNMNGFGYDTAKTDKYLAIHNV